MLSVPRQNGPSPADRPLGSPRCYGHPDDPHGPSPRSVVPSWSPPRCFPCWAPWPRRSLPVIPLPASGASPSATAGADPAALVHPLDGTGTGPVSPGTVGQFPGADVPFGMIQWSPDTSPNAVQAGGGYSYGDSEINGFSLTHLSGTGCPSYQDVPILPTEGAINSPATTVASFSHQNEHASPGLYRG